MILALDRRLLNDPDTGPFTTPPEKPTSQLKNHFASGSSLALSDSEHTVSNSTRLGHPLNDTLQAGVHTLSEGGGNG